MPYFEGLIYHVYNQGNNQQKIFFEEENYHFFIRKIQRHLIPFADLLCYCLMPNHFHWLLVPKSAGIHPGTAVKPRSKLMKLNASPSPHSVGVSPDFQQNLSQHIGILLSSYTKAINKRYERSGSLFRSKTKYKHGISEELSTKFTGQPGTIFPLGNHYAEACFTYIHQNPVKANLVTRAEDWYFSSAREYAGFAEEGICNQELARSLLNI